MRYPFLFITFIVFITVYYAALIVDVISSGFRRMTR